MAMMPGWGNRPDRRGIRGSSAAMLRWLNESDAERDRTAGWIPPFRDRRWPAARRGWLAAGLSILLLAGLTFLVHRTGGTQFVYVHLIYLPILLGAYFFGASGGIVFGMAAGLCMGPWMPLNVQSGIEQDLFNWIARTGFFTLFGMVAGLLCSSLVRQIEIIRSYGYFDRNTQLPNRLHLLEDLEERLGDEETASASVVVVTLRLAHYETVLTALGHQHGDALVAASAQRLKAWLSLGCTLYHLSGGTFAVMASNVSVEDGLSVADLLQNALDEPFLVNGVPILVGGQFGLARHPQHAQDGLALLRASAAALRDAVRHRQSYAVYDDRTDLELKEFAGLLPALQSALRNGNELMLHYQPKVDLDTGACVGVEALARWQHPERGMISPGRFIGLAERTVLIRPFTEWVLSTAVRQIAAWTAEGIEVPIAVNVSVLNLDDARLPATIAELLRRHDVDAERLEIEVTESAFMSAPAAAIRTLAAIRELGVSIALDDFGTGHSSLSYLRDLPADVLKLDQSFVRGLAESRKSQLIVGSTIATAHELGFKVVGEGVESQAIADRLLALSCDIGQGYLYAKPLPAAAFGAWLRSDPKPGSA